MSDQPSPPEHETPPAAPLLAPPDAPADHLPSPGPVASSGDAPYRLPDAPAIRRAIGHRRLEARDFFAVLAMVLIVDVSSWQPGGSGATFGIGGFGGALLLLAVPSILLLSASRWRASPRLAVVFSIAALLALRTAILPGWASALGGFLVLLAVPLALRSRKVSVPEVFRTMLSSIGALPSRLFASLEGVRHELARTPLTLTRALSVLVPLGVSLVFVAVFALANPLVADGLTWIWQLVGSFALPPFGRLVTWGVVLGMALLAIRPALVLVKDDERAIGALDASDQSLLIARNTLVALNALFVLYLLLDAVYLFDGRPPEGVTTQHYAHQGALWLTVALAMLTGVIGVMFRGPLSVDPRAHSIRRLAYAWTGLGLFLAVGTYQRMAIHIAHSGLSNLRIVGILGTTLVVVGMLITIEKLRSRRTSRWLLRRQLDAFALTFVLYALLPTHFIAAEVNAARIAAGERGPLLHVGPQSTHVESVLSLLPLLEDPDPRVREGVAALLLRADARIARELDGRDGWRESDLVTESVGEALLSARPRILEVLGAAEPDRAIEVLARLGDGAARDWRSDIVQ